MVQIANILAATSDFSSMPMVGKLLILTPMCLGALSLFVFATRMVVVGQFKARGRYGNSPDGMVRRDTNPAAFWLNVGPVYLFGTGLVIFAILLATGEFDRLNKAAAQRNADRARQNADHHAPPAPARSK